MTMEKDHVGLERGPRWWRQVPFVRDATIRRWHVLRTHRSPEVIMGAHVCYHVGCCHKKPYEV